MVNYLLKILIILLILPSLAFGSDAALKKEFGPELTQIPYFLLFEYNQKHDKDWASTDYTERKAYLIVYENNLKVTQAQEKAEAKAAVAAEKERLKEKKQALLKEKERQKAILAEEKAEEAAERARQKAFNDALKAQKKELEDLQRESSQSQD